MGESLVRPGDGNMKNSSLWVCVVAVLVICSHPQVCSGCESWEFRCLNGDCVKASLRCDAKVHCSDASDEFNCPALSPTVKWVPTPCNKGQFQCHNGRCIYPGWRCDGQDDCGDQSDEKSCPKIERAPIMSMGSIIGLSVAVAGLFMVVIAIAVMLTCIRRKNIMNAREMARQSRFFQQDRYPYSISGMILDREPPPRYSSHADLSILPPGITPEHLTNLSMEPPPYYSSQPDLRPAAFCPHVLEAPPCYSSQNDLSSSVVAEDHGEGAGQSPSTNLGLFQMTTSEVLRSAFEEDLGSLNLRGRRRSWSKESKDSLDSPKCGEDTAKPKGAGSINKDKSSDRESCKREASSGMEEYEQSRQLNTEEYVTSVDRNVRRNRLTKRCVSTPLMNHPTCSSENTGVDFSGDRQHMTRDFPTREEMGEIGRHDNTSNRRPYRKQNSCSLADIPTGNLLREETRDSIVGPEPNSEFYAPPARFGDNGQQAGIAHFRTNQTGPRRPHEPFSLSSTSHHLQEREHESLPVANGPAFTNSVNNLHKDALPTLKVHKLKPKKLQNQKRLSKSMSTLTHESSLHRQDSFSSVTSWDC